MLNPELKHLLLFLLLFFGYTAKSQKTIAQSFYFDTDSCSLKPAEVQKLHGFMQLLDSVSVKNVAILGYTDDVGRKTYNDTLSAKRAQAIKQSIATFEIDTNVIKITAGKGKLPLAGYHSIEEQRKNNRKVEVIVGYEAKIVTVPELIELEKLKVGEKLVLENILFEPSRHQFLAESYPVLGQLLQTLKQKPQYHLAILGHICCTPPGRDIKDFDTGEYNLSFARAKAVYDYLVANGINARRLSYQGMMANFPLGKGDKSDRRVELQVTSIVK